MIMKREINSFWNIIDSQGNIEQKTTATNNTWYIFFEKNVIEHAESFATG